MTWGRHDDLFIFVRRLNNFVPDKTKKQRCARAQHSTCKPKANISGVLDREFTAAFLMNVGIEITIFKRNTLENCLLV